MHGCHWVKLQTDTHRITVSTLNSWQAQRGMGWVVPINELTSFPASGPLSNPRNDHVAQMWTQEKAQHSASVMLPNRMEGVSDKLAKY
jgi:hypothetical protein